MVDASLDEIGARAVIHSGQTIYSPIPARHPFLAIETADIILRRSLLTTFVKSPMASPFQRWELPWQREVRMYFDQAAAIGIEQALIGLVGESRRCECLAASQHLWIPRSILPRMGCGYFFQALTVNGNFDIKFK